MYFLFLQTLTNFKVFVRTVLVRRLSSLLWGLKNKESKNFGHSLSDGVYLSMVRLLFKINSALQKFNYLIF